MIRAYVLSLRSPSRVGATSGKICDAAGRVGIHVPNRRREFHGLG